MMTLEETLAGIVGATTIEKKPVCAPACLTKPSTTSGRARFPGGCGWNSEMSRCC